jgi:polar amino acid transport system permease protein
MGESIAIVSQNFRPSEVYFIAGMYYLALVTITTWLLNMLEKHFYIPGFGRAK